MKTKFYKENRRKLLCSIDDKKVIVIVSSGYPLNRSADEDYEFQVNTNFLYLTGISQENTNLVLIKDNDVYYEYLYIDKPSEYHEKWIGHQLTPREVKEISGVNIKDVFYKDYFNQDLDLLLKDYKIVYLDLETKPNEYFTSFGLELEKKIKNEHKDVEIKDIYNNIITLRASKTKDEIEHFKKAIETTNIGILKLMENVTPGMYEYQLESYFDQAIKYNGNKPFSFKTIAAGGINATTLHYSANNCLLNDGDLVLFDLGCRDNGYCADITRTFPVNGKFNGLQREIYEIVLKTNKHIMKVAKAGMTLRELQQICIEKLADGCLKAGLIKKKDDIKKYYFHGVSHLIGLDTHDPYNYKEQTPLPVGAVISDEPGLYFKEYGIGIRIEDDILIKEKGCINLSANIIKEIDDIEEYMEKHNIWKK